MFFRQKSKIFQISIVTFIICFLIGVFFVALAYQNSVTDTFNDTSKIFATSSVVVDTSIGEARLEPWVCGNSITFIYKGNSVTYGTVLNSTTSECWMDRNLGASQVATAYNDSNAYGDLFQWGRLDDGHQDRGSATTTSLSSSDNPGHSNFINSNSSPYDWRSPQNDTLWQGASGTNNPCPSGWRIPTLNEWKTEYSSWSLQNYNGAFNSPLKLTVGGYRNHSTGSLNIVGSNGYYWTDNTADTKAYFVVFGDEFVTDDYEFRGNGYSVRCILN